MAGSVNRVLLIGNLGRDPEIRTTREGAKIATLSLATSESWNDRQTGERRERTEWHRVAVFNDRIVDVAERFLRKGSKVYVEGQLATRRWTDNQGNDRYTTEVVISRFKGELTMLDTRSGGSCTDDSSSAHGSAPTQRAPAGKVFAGDLDDEIPF